MRVLIPGKFEAWWNQNTGSLTSKIVLEATLEFGAEILNVRKTM